MQIPERIEITLPKKKYEKIVLFGFPGTGKSNTAKKLAEITGFPRLHSDEYIFGPGYSIEPMDKLNAAVKDLIENNEKWIIDYVAPPASIELFEWIFSKADIAISFVSTVEKSIDGTKRKFAEYDNGIMPVGIHAYDGYSSDATLKIACEAAEKYSLMYPELIDKLSNQPTTIKTLNSFDEIDRFIEEIKQEYEQEQIKIELSKVLV